MHLIDIELIYTVTSTLLVFLATGLGMFVLPWSDEELSEVSGAIEQATESLLEPLFVGEH